MSEDLDLSPWHEWPELYGELERRHCVEAQAQMNERPDREAGAHPVLDESRDERDS